MGYYENTIACKTEKELWETKKPVSASYMEKGQKNCINHDTTR